MLCELNQAVRMVCERGITQSGFQSHFEKFVNKNKQEGVNMAT